MTLHVAFSDAAADVLREALRLAGRNEAVIASPEAWNEGPLETTSRQAWQDDDPAFVEELDVFWARTLAAPDVTLWTNSRVAKDHAGFLAWLSRNPAHKVAVVDPAAFKRQDEPLIVPLLDPEDVVALGLLDATAHPASSALDALRAQWVQLTTENAPLRIIRDGVLVSAAADHFDAALLAATEEDWTPAGYVIGAVLADDLDDWTFNRSDHFLAERLQHLLDAGALESRPRTDALPHHRQGVWRLEVRRA